MSVLFLFLETSPACHFMPWTGCSFVQLYGCHSGTSLHCHKKLDFSSVLVLCFLDPTSFFLVYSLISGRAHLLFFEILHVSNAFSLYLIAMTYSIWGKNSFGILKAFVLFYLLVLLSRSSMLFSFVIYHVSCSFWKLLKSSLHSECSKI